MPNVSLRDLLEAGVHFGHQTRLWNPKMKPYIYGERNGIHIIDLQKTARGLVDAMRFITTTVQNGGTVLFVGTKRAAAVHRHRERPGRYREHGEAEGAELSHDPRVLLAADQSPRRGQR